MREAAGCHDIGQPRRNGGIGGRLWSIVLLGLLRGLGAEEHRIVGILVVAQRQKALVRQFELAPIGDADLGRALGVDVSVVRCEDVCRQVLDLAPALGASDRGTEAGFGEGIGQPCAHHIGGIGPAV